MPGAAITHNTCPCARSPGCAPARIALHADAIPHQCEVAMLAAHLGLVVLRLGAAFSLGRGFVQDCASKLLIGENWCSGSAIFNSVAGSPRPRRAVGSEEGDRCEVDVSTTTSARTIVTRSNTCSSSCRPDGCRRPTQSSRSRRRWMLSIGNGILKMPERSCHSASRIRRSTGSRARRLVFSTSTST